MCTIAEGSRTRQQKKLCYKPLPRNSEDLHVGILGKPIRYSGTGHTETHQLASRRVSKANLEEDRSISDLLNLRCDWRGKWLNRHSIGVLADGGKESVEPRRAERVLTISVQVSLAARDASEEGAERAYSSVAFS